VQKKAPHLTISDVLARFPSARLDIIGDGPLKHGCLSLIHERGLSGAVRLHGTQASDQVIEAMRRASVFVQHSVTTATGDTEGLPVAILEAMASGLPVVATRHGGIPEAVVEGLTGILVDENDVSGMGLAISSLLAEPARAGAMGSAGRERVLGHFTETHTRDRLRAIMGLSLRWRLSNSLVRGLSPDWIDTAHRSGRINPETF
jgi:glycosyltransferase involved in cell wall biosynthesis